MPVSDRSRNSAAAARPTLVRVIGRWTLTAAVINSVIGSGIYGLPSSVAGLVGEWSPLAVLIAGLCIFTIVLCFAEVGSRFDEAGGPYLYAREAFGAAVGFQIGWLHIWTRLLSAAAVLNVLAAYLGALVPAAGDPLWRAAAMTIGTLLVTAVNVIGVKQAVWTANAFTIAKLLPLALIIALGIFQIDRGVLATQAVPELRWTDAVLLLVFAYGGFESAIVAASETKNPKRDTAFAVIVAMLAITLIYSLVQLSVVGVLPEAAGQRASVAETLRVLLGPIGLTIGGLAVVISVYGWLTGFALMSPRIIYSMADRGDLPAWLAGVHPRFRTPATAIVFNTTIALALALYSNFAQAATFSAISRLLLYGTTCVALLALRRRMGPAPGFRVPAGPVVAALGVAFCLWMLTTRTLSEAWLIPVIMLVGGIPWFLARSRRGAPSTSTSH